MKRTPLTRKSPLKAKLGPVKSVATKPKKKSKETPRAKALKALQKLVRLKAADDNGYCTCVTCGRVDLWSAMDGGHFIPKGSSSYWALEEENIAVQCKPCNGFGMKYGDAAHRFTVYMIDLRGRDFVDHMLETRNMERKLYKRDYEEMINEWNEQIRYHMKRVGT